jgi:predicted hotdog family 3-hydroxylacyl-ACP dehydratase
MPNPFKLPMAAEGLIPHRLPMRQIDRLLEYSDGVQATVEALIDAENPLLDEDGQLAEVALVEMLAQSFAAVQGYADSLAGKPIGQGFLVGISQITIEGTARLGDRLLIHIRPIAALEGFVVVEGEVSLGNQTLASGKLKLWIPQAEVTTEPA